MLYEVSYVRDHKPETHLLPVAQARALRDYLLKTFRIQATFRQAR
jgi:hypothetical protein